jgi:F0F1-type ATP synthase membrane subunit b/b'
VADIVEQEAGRILEDAARTAADMLAAARSTAARLGADLAAEQAQRRREMEDAVADLADYLDALAHRLRTGAPLSVE